MEAPTNLPGGSNFEKSMQDAIQRHAPITPNSTIERLAKIPVPAQPKDSPVSGSIADRNIAPRASVDINEDRVSIDQAIDQYIPPRNRNNLKWIPDEAFETFQNEFCAKLPRDKIEKFANGDRHPALLESNDHLSINIFDITYQNYAIDFLQKNIGNEKIFSPDFNTKNNKDRLIRARNMAIATRDDLDWNGRKINDPKEQTKKRTELCDLYASTKFYDMGGLSHRIHLGPNPQRATKIIITSAKTMEGVAAGMNSNGIDTRNSDRKVGILGMANGVYIGGQLNSARAQEESEITQTATFGGLTLVGDYQAKQNEYKYANGYAHIPGGTVVVQNSRMIDMPSASEGEIDKDPKNVVVILKTFAKFTDKSSGYDESTLFKFETHNQDLVNRLKSDMRDVLDAAIAEGVTDLYLGASGCGVFGHIPAIEAYCWKQVLAEYHGYFNTVEFVIFDANSDNYRIFHNIFTRKFDEEELKKQVELDASRRRVDPEAIQWANAINELIAKTIAESSRPFNYNKDEFQTSVNHIVRTLNEKMSSFMKTRQILNSKVYPDSDLYKNLEKLKEILDVEIDLIQVDKIPKFRIKENSIIPTALEIANSRIYGSARPSIPNLLQGLFNLSNEIDFNNIKEKKNLTEFVRGQITRLIHTDSPISPQILDLIAIRIVDALNKDIPLQSKIPMLEELIIKISNTMDPLVFTEVTQFFDTIFGTDLIPFSYQRQEHFLANQNNIRLYQDQLLQGVINFNELKNDSKKFNLIKICIDGLQWDENEVHQAMYEYSLNELMNSIPFLRDEAIQKNLKEYLSKLPAGLLNTIDISDLIRAQVNELGDYQKNINLGFELFMRLMVSVCGSDDYKANRVDLSPWQFCQQIGLNLEKFYPLANAYLNNQVYSNGVNISLQSCAFIWSIQQVISHDRTPNTPNYKISFYTRGNQVPRSGKLDLNFGFDIKDGKVYIRIITGPRKFETIDISELISFAPQ